MRTVGIHQGHQRLSRLLRLMGLGISRCQAGLGSSQKNGKLEVAPRRVIALRVLLGFAQRAEQVPECLAGRRLANEDPARLAFLRPPTVACPVEVLPLVQPQYLARPLAD